MELKNDILEAIGNTPLVRLNRVTRGIPGELYAKCEFLNPGGSIKDRIGAHMIEEAEKNYRWVTVLSDPLDYNEFILELEKNGGTTEFFRQKMAQRTFQRTSQYDAMIAQEWAEKNQLPFSISLEPQMPLRYGENPHQNAAWVGKSQWKVIQGKELSYNNILDAEAAFRLALEFSQPAVSIIKHNNPCGVASLNDSVTHLFQKALSCDSRSAFGGIVASNAEIDEEAAHEMSQLFLEVVIAKNFTEGALKVFSQKKNLRLIHYPQPHFSKYELRSALGGWLLQTSDNRGIPDKLELVTQKKTIDEKVMEDLKFSWLVCKHVRSNAIVIAKDGKALGIGAGQMSRIDAVSIALSKSQEKNIQGAVLASDAFFPFRDNIDLLKNTGITAIIQPGGSQRDGEVIQACNEHNISLFLTGVRHFRH